MDAYLGLLIACKGRKPKSIVLVISPLVALMKDQVNNFASKGLSAGYVSQKIPPMR